MSSIDRSYKGIYSPNVSNSNSYIYFGDMNSISLF